MRRELFISGLYVDDCLCVGDKEAINEVLELMKTRRIKSKSGRKSH